METRAYTYDSDTGLTHFGAREYDAETGSFTRKDPSGFEGGENRYAYAGGDPVNCVDPDGNFIQAVILGAALAGAEGGLDSYVTEGVSQAPDPEKRGAVSPLHRVLPMTPRRHAVSVPPPAHSQALRDLVLAPLHGKAMPRMGF